MCSTPKRKLLTFVAAAGLMFSIAVGFTGDASAASTATSASPGDGATTNGIVWCRTCAN